MINNKSLIIEVNIRLRNTFTMSIEKALFHIGESINNPTLCTPFNHNKNTQVIKFVNLKKIVGKPSFIDQFKKIIKRYKRVGYNMDIMRQSVRLVENQITVNGYGYLFNCTTVGQASDSMTTLT